MATPNQESIEMFMSITGSSGPVAIQKLTEHGGNLNEAVNAHFSGDTNIHQTDVVNATPPEDFMDIDGPNETTNHMPPFTTESASRIENLIETLPENEETPSIDNDTGLTPSAPVLPDHGIEEEMIRAAIEASKNDAILQQAQLDDPAISHAVSLSLQSSKQEKTFNEAGPSEETSSNLSVIEQVGTSSNGSHVEEENSSLPLGPTQHQNVNNHVDSDNEWGGMSTEEHDEAVMLEAAMFGGVHEGIGHRVRYARGRHRNMQNGYNYRAAVRPPSPSLTAQRLIREQQDDEYLAALQADREKELLEKAAKEAAIEEARKKLEQEQEIERELTEKEATLPEEPKPDAENAVTLLVRMPDGSRRGRRFLRTDKLQCLLDFIDVERVVKPSTYRLVRPYPRRAFGDGESGLTLNELGLSSKQEALFLELI